MEIPSVTNNSSFGGLPDSTSFGSLPDSFGGLPGVGSFGGLPGGGSSGGLPGGGSSGGLPGGNLFGNLSETSIFPQEAGDITEIPGMPGGSSDGPGGMPSFGSFSGSSLFDFSDILESLMKLLKKILQSIMKDMKSFDFSGTGEFTNASQLPGSGFEIDGEEQLPGEGCSCPDQSPGANQKTYTADPGGDSGGGGSSGEYGAPAPTPTSGNETPAATPGEETSSSGGSITGPANGKYDETIEKYAKKYGVSSDEVKVIMAKESQGNPDAVSPAGAVGLMQVKPETASEVLGRPVTAEELKDPEFNIMVGTMYYAKLKREKGSTEDALGAYNQGPNADWRSIPESVEYVDTLTKCLRNGTLPTWG